jgi:hypothetical protein
MLKALLKIIVFIILCVVWWPVAVIVAIAGIVKWFVTK